MQGQGPGQEESSSLSEMKYLNTFAEDTIDGIIVTHKKDIHVINQFCNMCISKSELEDKFRPKSHEYGNETKDEDHKSVTKE
eukprot:5321066-Ditylum_brightwellii.AAC.1